LDLNSYFKLKGGCTPKKIMKKDEKWMLLAIKEAKLAESEGEVPVGAVLVKEDLLIAKAHNQSILKNNATAHAEMQTIQLAGKKLNNYRLNGTTLYVTLEPCAMCFGAMIHARIERIVYGAYDSKTGVCGSCGDLRNAMFFKHSIVVTSGVLEVENQKILKSFFNNLRLLKKNK
jgi:tRNA(adenine34) deaminase